MWYILPACTSACTDVCINGHDSLELTPNQQSIKEDPTHSSQSPCPSCGLGDHWSDTYGQTSAANVTPIKAISNICIHIQVTWWCVVYSCSPCHVVVPIIVSIGMNLGHMFVLVVSIWHHYVPLQIEATILRDTCSWYLGQYGESVQVWNSIILCYNTRPVHTSGCASNYEFVIKKLIFFSLAIF